MNTPVLSHPLVAVIGDVHHHTFAKFTVETTEVIALNLITTKGLSYQRKIQPGWAALFNWDGESLQFLQTCPAV